MGNQGLKIGVRAPEFTLPSTSGKQLSLSDFEQKPVIIVFLRGTW